MDEIEKTLDEVRAMILRRYRTHQSPELMALSGLEKAVSDLVKKLKPLEPLLVEEKK